MKLLVLDGNSILNRAFYGIKLLTTKSGEFTNGIVGFLNILEKVKDETEPDAVAIAFDMKAPTFRHKAYAGYKAQRKGMREARKHVAWYMHGLRGAAEFRRMAGELETLSDLDKLLEKVYIENKDVSFDP